MNESEFLFTVTGWVFGVQLCAVKSVGEFTSLILYSVP